jgi:hypothetical protein
MPALRQVAPPAAAAHPPVGLLDPGPVLRRVNAGSGLQELLAGHSVILRRRP